MAIKLHGTPYSGNVLRVAAALYEKDVDFEHVDVDMRAGAHKQPDFLALNPFGQVPALEDGDLKLFESRAITKYISYAYESNGTPLLAKEPKEMANLAVWLEVEAHQFDPVASTLAWELAVKQLLGLQMDEVAVKEQEPKLAKVLDVYEARLAQSKYLAGDTFSLADLHHLPNLQYLSGTHVMKLFDERPHVSTWYKDIMARESWTKSLALQKPI